MAYTLIEQGDWLEKQAAAFVAENIPAYELIWQNYIGHKGNGKMAEIQKISEEDENIRRQFAQHHYTILESLYFMQKIVDDESDIKEIKTFDDYRRGINQLMSYHSYSGRLRDNMEKCFIIMGAKDQANEATAKLDAFYSERHVFMHGKKVPFTLDADNLYKTPKLKKGTLSPRGYGLDTPWNAITNDDMVYLEESLKESMRELKPVVNSLLQGLFKYVKNIIKKNSFKLEETVVESTKSEVHFTQLSGSNFTIITRNTSGST